MNKTLFTCALILALVASLPATAQEELRMERTVRMQVAAALKTGPQPLQFSPSPQNPLTFDTGEVRTAYCNSSWTAQLRLFPGYVLQQDGLITTALEYTLVVTVNNQQESYTFQATANPGGTVVSLPEMDVPHDGRIIMQITAVAGQALVSPPQGPLTMFMVTR